MATQEEQFFNENISKANKFLRTLLLYSMALPAVLLIGKALGIMQLPLDYLVLVQAFSAAAFLFNTLIGKTARNTRVSRNCLIVSLVLFMGLLSSNMKASIYVSYGFIPFLSSLYYSKKFTRCTTLMTLAAAIGSMAFKSVTSPELENGSRLQFFWTMGAGFSFELFLTHCLAVYMVQKNFKMLTSLLNVINESNEMNFGLTEKNIQLEETQQKILQFVSKILGSHDFFTGNHVIHTKTYTGIVSRDLKKRGLYTEELTEKNISMFETAALLHDIGKIHIPEGILNKTNSLSHEEFEIMKSHPEEGRKLLEFLPPIEDGKFNRIAKDMALYHHEKWDGSGYPEGLSGTGIPLCARIMAAADVLDALLSRRLYKSPMSADQITEIFRNMSGIHFEPCISESIIRCMDKITACDQFFKKEEEKENVTELEWWQRYHSYIEKKRGRSS